MNYRVLILIACIAFAVFGGLMLFRRYARLSGEKAFLALLGSLIAGGALIYYHVEVLKRFAHSNNEVRIFFGVAASGIFVVFLTAFAIRLWGCWIGENAIAEERQPGLAGIRAWFSASNIFVGGMLVLTAWLGIDISPLLGTVVVAALLAAYPVIRMESMATAPASVAGDLSVEREKIVSMLEAGKLTAEESAELLQALGESSRVPSRQVPLTVSQRLMLIGAALVVLGFFLPWFIVNPGKEAGRMMQQMNIPADSAFGGGNGGVPAGFPFAGGQIKTPTLTLTGGDIQRGLGWATLLLALAAALIPYVATTLDGPTTRIARMLFLGVGGLIVLYLFTQNFRFVGVGLVIAVGGYALEILGAMRERHALSL